MVEGWAMAEEDWDSGAASAGVAALRSVVDSASVAVDWAMAEEAARDSAEGADALPQVEVLERVAVGWASAVVVDWECREADWEAAVDSTRRLLDKTPRNVRKSRRSCSVI